MPDSGARRDEILEFWFGSDSDGQLPASFRSEWFKKDPAFDAEITRRFHADYAFASSGGWGEWEDDPLGSLALILLLDQFPRNMFRNDARAYATDARARDVAQHAIAKGFDKERPPAQRLFFYVPFQHSEDKVMQDRGLELHRSLPGWEQPGSPFQYAQRHWDIIRRFGRFPHRNAALGRESTPAELEFLKEPCSNF